jgi:hypothetical protein
MSFFVHESCGYCTPCRVGNVFLQKAIAKFRKGKAEPLGHRLPARPLRHDHRDQPLRPGHDLAQPDPVDAGELPAGLFGGGEARRRVRATFDIQSHRRRAPAGQAPVPHLRQGFQRNEPDLSSHCHRRGGDHARGRPDDHGGRGRRGHLHPAALRSRGAAPPGRLPGLHGEGNGRSVAACTQPASPGAEIENETPMSPRCAATSWRCCFTRATTCARSARRAAIASCRRWPTGWSMTDADALSLSRALPRGRCLPSRRCARYQSLHLLRALHPRLAGCRWQGHLRLRGPGHSPPRRRQRPRPRPYRHEHHRCRDLGEEVCPVGCIIRKRVGFSVQADRRAGIRQGPDRQRYRGRAR